jgi:phage terminase large subunit GpA-like protein
MVGERLTTDVPRGTVPSDATWLFAGVDVQDQYFVYTVVACGPGERCYLVDHGYCDSWDEVRDRVLHRDFPHEDGTASLRPALTLVDSGDGNRTHEIYRKCREYSTASHAVMPCKGANSNCNGEPYQKVTIGEGTKSGKRLLRRHALATRGVVLVRVNPWYWEPVIQKWLDETSPGEAESLSLPSGSDQDDDLLTQLCNAAQSKQPSKTDPDHLIWIPRWEDKPNDIRDAIKYARCAMEVKFRGDWRIAERPQASPPVVARATPTTAEPAESRGRSGRRSRIRERRSRRR